MNTVTSADSSYYAANTNEKTEKGPCLAMTPYGVIGAERVIYLNSACNVTHVTVRDGDGVTGEGRLVLKPNFHVNKWSVVIKYIQLEVYLLTTSDD